MRKPCLGILRKVKVVLLLFLIHSECCKLVAAFAVGARPRERCVAPSQHCPGCSSTIVSNRKYGWENPPFVLASSSSDHHESSPQPQRTASNAQAFLEHMYREKGVQGEFGDVEFRCDEVTGQCGLVVAAENGIAQGDYVFAVPLNACWVVEETVHSHDGDATTADGELSDAERGLLFWEWQQQHGEKDVWQSYKDILPTRNEAFDPTPDFWSEEQIRALQVPTLIERALAKKKGVASLATKLLDSKDAEEHQRLTEDDLRFASWVVNSRAVTVILDNDDDGEDIGDEEDFDDEDDDYDWDDEDFEDINTTCVLVPLLDMINHDWNPNAYFDILGDDDDDDGNGSDDNEEENLYIAVIADRDLRQGEELSICYGFEADSSIELLLQYGFVPKDNPADWGFWNSFCAAETTKTDSCGQPELFWTTSLQEDEEELLELQGKEGMVIERTILEFRIRMKRAYVDYTKSIAQ